MEHILLHIDSSKHANLDSFPFRYGFTFRTSERIKLSPVNGKTFNRKRDAKYRDRYHVDAKFINPNSGNIESGHFVIVEDNNAKIDRIATVWRVSGDVRTETHLSEVIRKLRESGFITVEDILKMNPLYISGSLRTHADLIQYLAKESSSDEILELKKIAKLADERAEQLLSELDSTKEELKKVKKDNQDITNKNNELHESIEFEIYAREEAEESAIRESASRIEAEARADVAEQKLAEYEVQAYKSEQSIANSSSSNPTISESHILLTVDQDIMHRGSLCTRLTLGDGSNLYMKTSTFDKDLLVTKKAKSLEGKNVRTTCWDPISQPGKWSSQGYFRNIYEAK